MQNNRNMGLLVGGLGLLLVCLLCPLVLDVLMLTTGGRAGMYSQVFSLPIGPTTLANVITSGQLACACVLGLAVFAAGIALVVRSRQNTVPPAG